MLRTPKAGEACALYVAGGHASPAFGVRGMAHSFLLELGLL